jgi:4-amino-4-deoxy-L-arabinose transferase-like glycosyltransferase
MNDRPLYKSVQHWFWVVPLLLLAATLGAARLNIDLFWSDEEYTVYMSAGSHHGPADLLEILIRIADNVWPPLHNLILIPWAAVFGWSAFSLRVLALFFGLLAIAMLYRLGRDMFSPRVGLVAVILLATSTFFIHYLHEGRGYTLYVLLTLTTLWCYWRLITHPAPSRRLQVLFVLSGTLLLYVHYVASVVMAAVGLYHITLVKAGERRTHIFRLMLVIGFLFGPWLTIGLLVAAAEREVSRGWDALTVLVKSLDGFGNGLIPLVILVLAYALLRLRGRNIKAVGFLLVAIFVLALLFNLATDYLFNIRHILPLLPLLLLVSAAVIVDVSQRYHIGVAGVIVAVWVVAGAWNYIDLNGFDARMEQIDAVERAPMQAALSLARTCAADDAGLLFHLVKPAHEVNTWQVFDYYLHDDPWMYTQAGAFTRNQTLRTISPEPGSVQAADVDTVWVFSDDAITDTEPLDGAQAYLAGEYTTCQTFTDDSGLRGWRYTRVVAPACLPDPVPCGS